MSVPPASSASSTIAARAEVSFRSSALDVLSREAFSVVLDAEDRGAVLRGEIHFDVLCVRVRGDVAKDLVRHPEDQRRAVFTKPEIGRQVEFGVGALALHLAQHLEQRSLKALPAKRRRRQFDDQRAQILHGAAGFRR